jgi:glycosyltransferase involved in cell wall biosynthesis
MEDTRPIGLYSMTDGATHSVDAQVSRKSGPLPNRRISLSVFFPCYNEEANVERTTRAAFQALARITDDYEVIIVDDGSKDRTGEIADRLAQEHPCVRAVHNRPNLGYGGALQRGFREARKPWVFYTDGDGQFDFEEIEKLLPLLDRYDIVSAYRINRQDPWLRKLYAFAWTSLVNLVFGLWLRDIDCAFKIYPRRLFEEIEMRSMGALIDTEVLARAKRLGYRIGQVGVHHYPRVAGTQTGANLRVILRAFKELFVLRKDILRTGRTKARLDAPAAH